MDPTTTKNFENQSAGQRILAIDLPAPEETEDYAALPDTPPHAELTFGALDGSWRFIRGIPACVWVVNMHKEEITVLVSKYGPNRQLSGGGINASATGGGLNINTTPFPSPATKKTLAPFSNAVGPYYAKFPLWERSNGFGVITVFKGAGRTLYIENDRLPAGATAYFNNTPNMKMKDYSGEEIN